MPTCIELLDVSTRSWRAAQAKTWPFRALGGGKGSGGLLGGERFPGYCSRESVYLPSRVTAIWMAVSGSALGFGFRGPGPVEFRPRQSLSTPPPPCPPHWVWDLHPTAWLSRPQEHCSLLASTAIGKAVLSGVYCCCINLHLKWTIKCFWTCQTRIKIFCSISAYVQHLVSKGL